jgi:hypothetical protein
VPVLEAPVVTPMVPGPTKVGVACPTCVWFALRMAADASVPVIEIIEPIAAPLISTVAEMSTAESPVAVVVNL